MKRSLAVLGLVVMGCGGSAYQSRSVNDFMVGCVAGGRKSGIGDQQTTYDTCSCALKHLRQRYSARQLGAMGRSISAGKPVPDVLRQRLASCSPPVNEAPPVHTFSSPAPSPHEKRDTMFDSAFEREMPDESAGRPSAPSVPASPMPYTRAEEPERPGLPECPDTPGRPPFPTGLGGFRFGMTLAQADSACRQVTDMGLYRVEGFRALSCDAVPTPVVVGAYGQTALLGMCDGRVCLVSVALPKANMMPDWQSSANRLIADISLKYGPPSCSVGGWGFLWLWQDGGAIHVTSQGSEVHVHYITKVQSDQFRRQRKDAY